MSYPRYPKYKDSGVDWLGDMPEGWSIVPFLGIAKERTESNAGMIEQNLLSLSYGNIIPKDIGSSDGLLPASFETYQIVEPDDIVFRLTDLQNDKRSLRTGIVKERGIITSAYVAVYPSGIYASYFAHLLRAYDEEKVFYSMGGGLRQTLKYKELSRLPVVLPSETEQQAIAAFLDSECAKTDALIAEQEKLIALLQEKRQAVISHAVTKGLNPDAPMKDSGVEWLGEVPIHWTPTRLKFTTEAIVDCPHDTPLYSEEGQFLVIRTADIFAGILDTTHMYRLEQPDYEHRIRRRSLQKGDIVYGREGERWGFAALVPEDNMFCLGQRMMQFVPSQDINPSFLMWQLNSRAVYEQGVVDTVGATSPHVNVWTIKNYSLVHPPLSEQQAIVAYLDTETAKIDALIAEAEKGVVLLKERKSALIAAVVTGKIDVRGLVPAQTLAQAPAQTQEAV